jgi:ribosomal protein S15P/S13E
MQIKQKEKEGTSASSAQAEKDVENLKKQYSDLASHLQAS